jgi:hypothetical protein
MKRLLVSVLSVSCALWLGGCVCVPCLDLRPLSAQASPKPGPAPAGDLRIAYDGVEIERVVFRTGVSSATVERLAKAASCTGGMGAGLITDAGPVEVYRMACDNGKVFLARCELRQCKPM